MRSGRERGGGSDRRLERRRRLDRGQGRPRDASPGRPGAAARRPQAGLLEEARPDPDVPRHREPARDRPAPRALRRPRHLHGADEVAQSTGLRRRQHEPGLRRLVRGRQAPGEAGGALLRRRLPGRLRLRTADAAPPALAGEPEPARQQPGRRDQRRDGRADDRRGLGARLPHDQPPRPDDPGRRQAAPGGRGLPADPAEALPSAGELLLLPGRQVRRGRRSRPFAAPATGARRQSCRDKPLETGCSSSTAFASTARTASAACARSCSRPARSYFRFFLHFFFLAA